MPFAIPSRSPRRAATLFAAIVLLAGAAACDAADRKEPRQGKASAAREKRGQAREDIRGPFGQDADAYVLSFSEEFDRFDPGIWNDHIWYESSNPTRNYAVENGMLKIWPQRDADGRFFNRTIDTDRKFYQKYGYVEMEAKLPRGRGVWPAFWLLAHPGERRPEIDIMEAYPAGEGWGYVDKHGMHRPNVYGTTVWIDKDRQTSMKMNEVHTDLSADFHKYGVKWEPARLTFYFDGKPVHTVEEVRMGDPMYILLDLWFGSAAGDPDDTTPQGKSNAFEVKYVRAWQFRHVPGE